MKIRTRLILTFTLLSLLAAAVAATAVGAFPGTGEAFAAARDRVGVVEANAALATALARQDRGFLLLLSGQPEFGLRHVQDGEQAFAAALDLAFQAARNDDEKSAVTAIQDAHAAFLAAAAPFRAPPPRLAGGLVLSGPRQAAYLAAVDAPRAAVDAALLRLSGLAQSRVEEDVRQGEQRDLQRTVWVLGVGLFGLLVSFLLVVRLVRGFVRPVEELTRAVVAVGRGDRGRRVGYSGDDEFGMIAAAVNATVERLAASDAAQDGEIRLHRRFAASILDALAPDGLVVDRQGRTVLSGVATRDRLGNDPLASLRAGGAGLLPPGHIDRMLEEVLAGRAGAGGRSTSGSVTARPVLGTSGAVLGVLITLGSGTSVLPPAAGGPPPPRPGTGQIR